MMAYLQLTRRSFIMPITDFTVSNGLRIHERSVGTAGAACSNTAAHGTSIHSTQVN